MRRWQMVEDLRRHGVTLPAFEEGENPADYLTTVLFIERHDNTNSFRLGESYEDSEDFDDFTETVGKMVQRFVAACKKKNPWFEWRQ